MDGRIQEPVIEYIKAQYQVDYVDVITEAGPCKITSQEKNYILMDSILNRVQISVNKHGSKILFISGHFDCAGNPVSKEFQLKQLGMSATILQKKYPDLQIVKLWINEHQEVEKI